ncbi:MAG: hypothetical protein ACPL4I_12040 [Bacteroidota bacterium]
MNLDKIADIRGAGKWALLAVVYALLAFAYLQGRWEIWYAVPYILGFASVAFVLTEEKPKLVTSLCAALIGVLSVVASGYSSTGALGPGQIVQTQSIAVITVVLFAVLLVSEFGFIDIGGKSSATRYLVLAAFLAWAIWAFDYFRLRMLYGLPIPLETVLNHGSIMLLGVNEALKMVGVKYEYQDELSVLFALAACLGAVLLVASLGWGLGLLNVP